ncbi:MAG: TIGR02679 family protein [Lysobacter sp.]|nr:TIGR02679 family protein [Lysobacter sp.]
MSADDRLQRLLGGETLAPLRLRLRRRFERAAAAAGQQAFRIGRLTPAEHAALARLQGRPARFSASMQVDVAVIDAALRDAGVADSLRAALERIDGRMVDRAAERAATGTRWRMMIAGCEQPVLASLLQESAGIGLLKRLSGQDSSLAARTLADAAAVLEQLPAHGMSRARLAADVLGDAHALDKGRAVATLVLAVLRSILSGAATMGPRVDPDSARLQNPSSRALWASAGVLVNELARPALVLNVPGTITTPGEPTYLSLRRLLRSPPEWVVQGRTVFVCENPNLLAIAADHLGAGCAPLVCTDGMPAAAQRTVLAQLARAGATLRYHGDFDWAGMRIGNHVMREHGAGPWRFDASDYRNALRVAPSPGRQLQGAAVEASWDEALTATMRAAKLAIDEEMVAGCLLEDLATASA